jgi:flagellar biosynthesis protein
MNQKNTEKKDIKLKKRVADLDLHKKGNLKVAAIKYDVGNDKAPKILGFGKGKIAENILKVAEEHKVPFYEDASLVELLSKLEVNSEIPPALFNVVAELLSFVYKLDRLAKKRSQVIKKHKDTRHL